MDTVKRTFTTDTARAAATAEGQGFFIVWNPNAPMPPTQVFPTYRQANVVADKLAAKHQGEKFYVLEAVSVSQTVQVTTKPIKRNANVCDTGTLAAVDDLDDLTCNPSPFVLQEINQRRVKSGLPPIVVSVHR